jgi:hypothetical protein
MDMTEGFVVDFSDIADLGPVDPGTYVASIVKATPGMSQSGNPKIDVSWKIEEGDYEGRQVFDTLSFHPNALSITKAKLLNMGFPEDFSGAIDPEDLLGITATLTVTIEKSTAINDETGEPYPPRNRVTRISGGSADLEDLL